MNGRCWRERGAKVFATNSNAPRSRTPANPAQTPPAQLKEIPGRADGLTVRARARIEGGWWAAALAGVAVMSWLTLQGFAWNDYDDEVSVAFQALIAGDIGGFLGQLPAYGGSLVLRAPFAGATAAPRRRRARRLSSRLDPVPAGRCGLRRCSLVRRLRRSVAARAGVRALVLGLCVCQPDHAAGAGDRHPEELLGAVLAWAPCSGRRRPAPVWPPVLLGLAVATKSWAVLAIGPVVLTLPAGRCGRSRAAATAAALVLVAAVGLRRPRSPRRARSRVERGQIFQPWQAWWFLGERRPGRDRRAGASPSPASGAAGLARRPLHHPLVALCLSAAVAAGRPAPARLRPWRDSLLLLALLLLLRCLLDPWNVVYYELPFLLALLTLGGALPTERPPVLALTATAVAWVTLAHRAQAWLSPDMQSLARSSRARCRSPPGWPARRSRGRGPPPSRRRLRSPPPRPTRRTGAHEAITSGAAACRPGTTSGPRNRRTGTAASACVRRAGARVVARVRRLLIVNAVLAFLLAVHVADHVLRRPATSSCRWPQASPACSAPSRSSRRWRSSRGAGATPRRSPAPWA